MSSSKVDLLSRRGFCLCCIGAAVAGRWLTPHEAFAEARGIVSLIKDSAAASPIVTHRLRDNISVLEGSGGTVAVLTGPDGKVLIDAGIAVSRPQMTKALADIGADPITHLVNTHWHFDHTDGNAWLNDAGAKIIAQENTRKYSVPRSTCSRLGLQFSCTAAGRNAGRGIYRRTHSQAKRVDDRAQTVTVRRIPTAIFPLRSSKRTSSTWPIHSGMASIRSSTIRPAAASTG